MDEERPRTFTSDLAIQLLAFSHAAARDIQASEKLVNEIAERQIRHHNRMGSIEANQAEHKILLNQIQADIIAGQAREQCLKNQIKELLAKDMGIAKD